MFAEEEEGQVVLPLSNSCRPPPWLCLLAERTAEHRESLTPSSENPLLEALVHLTFPLDASKCSPFKASGMSGPL